MVPARRCTDCKLITIMPQLSHMAGVIVHVLLNELAIMVTQAACAVAVQYQPALSRAPLSASS